MSSFFNSKNKVIGEVTGLTPTIIADLMAKQLVPRGSAVISSGGNMAPTINAVLQAGTGTMDTNYNPMQPYYQPSLQSVEDSISACFQLGGINSNKRIAVPFIGGNIFKSRIFKGQNLPVSKQDELLVSAIVNATITSAGQDNVDFCLVAYDTLSYNLFLADLQKNHPSVDTNTHLVQGDITDYSLHGSDAVVNAANMEVVYGGGMSGSIGRAVGNQVAQDKIAKADIAQLWAEYAAI